MSTKIAVIAEVQCLKMPSRLFQQLLFCSRMCDMSFKEKKQKNTPAFLLVEKVAVTFWYLIL